jgi:tetratricopeptide (TPR) repeat protein
MVAELSSNFIGNLWRWYEAARKEENYQSATGIAEQAVTIYRQKGDLRHAGIWQRALGNALYYQGHYRDSAAALRIAVNLQPDRYEKALTLGTLGLAESLSGRRREASSAFSRASRLMKEFPDDVYLWSHFYGMRAVMMDRAGRTDEAIIDWEGAASLLRRNGYLWRAAVYINNIALALINLGSFQEAEERLLQACCLVAEQPNSYGEGLIEDTFGYLCMLEGRYVEAEAHLERSASLFRSSGNTTQLVEALLHLTDVYRQTGRFEKGREQAKEAWRLAMGIDSPVLYAHARDKYLRVTEEEIRQEIHDPS